MSSATLKRILHRTLIPKPDSTHSISLFTTVLSPPSNPTSSSDPLITDAVSILTHHRSKSRWSTLRSLTPSGFTPSQFSDITLRFLFTRRNSLCSHDVHSCSTLIHILARSRLKSHARDVLRLALRLASHDGGEDRVSKVFLSLIKSYNRCGSAPFVFDLLHSQPPEMYNPDSDGPTKTSLKYKATGVLTVEIGDYKKNREIESRNESIIV